MILKNCPKCKSNEVYGGQDDKYNTTIHCDYCLYEVKRKTFELTAKYWNSLKRLDK